MSSRTKADRGQLTRKNSIDAIRGAYIAEQAQTGIYEAGLLHQLVRLTVDCGHRKKTR